MHRHWCNQVNCKQGIHIIVKIRDCCHQMNQWYENMCKYHGNGIKKTENAQWCHEKHIAIPKSSMIWRAVYICHKNTQPLTLQRCIINYWIVSSCRHDMHIVRHFCATSLSAVTDAVQGDKAHKCDSYEHSVMTQLWQEHTQTAVKCRQSDEGARPWW